jgi:peroxiredoxin
MLERTKEHKKSSLSKVFFVVPFMVDCFCCETESRVFNLNLGKWSTEL